MRELRRQPLLVAVATILSAVAVLSLPSTVSSLEGKQSRGASAHRAGLGSRAAEARLWVVQPPVELVAFSGDLVRIGVVDLPEFAFADPKLISVNTRGQILARSDGDTIWVWDGKRWRARSRPPNQSYLAPTVSTSGSCNRTWFLGASGNSLFMLETSTAFWPGDYDADSAHNAARMEETDFDLHPLATVFDLPYLRCEHNPSPVELYTEPCYEAQVAAPGGVVDEFFVLNRQEAIAARSSEGGSASAADRLSLFVRDQRGWRTDALSLNGQTFVDRGRTQIGSEADVGCCSWSNENSDNSWIVREGVTTGFFDEWSRYRNENYDVSFFAMKPMPSPDRRAVGFTIRAAGELRESADGHPDTLELQRVEAGLAELPVAEVVTLDPKPATLWRMAKTEFAGWLDLNRVLIVDHGVLVIFDVRTGRRRDTGIRVRGGDDVIVVAP